MELLDIKYEEYIECRDIPDDHHYCIMQIKASKFVKTEGTGVLKIKATKPANDDTGCMACRGSRVYTSCPRGPRAMPNPTYRFIIAARHEVHTRGCTTTTESEV